MDTTTIINEDIPCCIVIPGASGDLAKRKIYPALFSLFCKDLLPREFSIAGFSRTRIAPIRIRQFRPQIRLDPATGVNLRPTHVGPQLSFSDAFKMRCRP